MASTAGRQWDAKGIASRFARERQSPHHPETIAGTLAYIAPEHLGGRQVFPRASPGVRDPLWWYCPIFDVGAFAVCQCEVQVSKLLLVRDIAFAVDKVDRAQALRRAMLILIDTGKDYEVQPAYWAPFVLVGEGSTGR
jgi:hypothetical protein